MDNTLSIVIGSCDAYIDIASLYVKFLRKNWPDCKSQIYVVSEKKEVNEDNVITIKNENGEEWAERITKALKSITTKYVWLTVDDLFISKDVDNSRIVEILNIMEKEGLHYYGFIPKMMDNKKRERLVRKRIRYKNYDYILMISKDIPYGVNMGTAIWNRDALIEILEDGITTAWDVENYFLEKASKRPGGYYEWYVDDDGTSLHYSHMIKKGKWIQKGVSEISNSGIFINYSERGFVPFSSRIRTIVVGTGNTIVPIKYRAIVKKALTKVGFRFATKY